MQISYVYRVIIASHSFHIDRFLAAAVRVIGRWLILLNPHDIRMAVSQTRYGV